MLSSPLKSSTVNIIIKAIYLASRNTMRDFSEVDKLTVNSKGMQEFISATEGRITKVLKREFALARPDFGFIVEGQEIIFGSDPSSFWIIDPIDGTKNFMRGIPHFAISIAVQKLGDIFSAVIYDPIRDEVFTAEKGMGAYMNDYKLRVSDRKNIMDTLVAVGSESPLYPYTRKMGSTSLDLAYVAAGRFDGFVTSSSHIWDFAAGSLLVREAGGLVGDFNGAKPSLKTSSIVASNVYLFDGFVNSIKKAS
jgi:myo-inositol-1(or 4)-monophosphatase